MNKYRIGRTETGRYYVADEWGNVVYGLDAQVCHREDCERWIEAATREADHAQA